MKRIIKTNYENETLKTCELLSGEIQTKDEIIRNIQNFGGFYFTLDGAKISEKDGKYLQKNKTILNIDNV